MLRRSFFTAITSLPVLAWTRWHKETPKDPQEGDPKLTITEKLEKLANCIAIQCRDGNWNYDPYMHGMANGMIFAESVFTNEDPDYLDPPEDGFLYDAANKITFAEARQKVCAEMQSDEGLSIAYQSNIACLLHDRDGLSWDRANETADAMMNLLFETSLPVTRRTDGEV